MGKALIVSGGAAGSYTIKPLHNRVRIEAEITRLEELLTQLNERLAELEVDLLVAEVDVLDARDALNAIIDAAAAVGEIPDSNELRAATADLLEASKVRDLLKIDRDMEKARVLETQAELRALGAIPLDKNQQAWCADYIEDLAGEVATAEIPGEGNARIIIRPGSFPDWEYNAIRDGQLFHRPGQSSAQVFFNAAILPGWQKWMPTYRVGVLTSVDTVADTGAVTLDAEISSADALPINQSATLAGVPILYMSCNADAFEVGDRVLVEFVGRDWSAPRVIGFESNPKECPFECPEDWPAYVDVFLNIDSTRTYDGGAWGQFSETLSTFTGLCSVSTGNCSLGPFEETTFQYHSGVPTSPGTYDVISVISIKYGAATMPPAVSGDDFSVDAPTGAIWSHQQEYGGIFEGFQRAKVSNPLTEVKIDLGGAEFAVELDRYSRLYSGGQDRPIHPVGCFFCSSPPVFPIYSVPNLTNTDTIIRSSNNEEILGWLMGQGVSSTITVTNDTTNETAAYQLTTYNLHNGSLRYFACQP